MPQPPIVSLSNFLNAATSSSRKRSHAEITRSESRSASPHIPSKRRRISPNASSSSTRSSHFSLSQSPPPVSTRYPGDGYDYRRPTMSATTIRSSPPQTDVTIDLTLDSDETSIVSDNSTPPRSPHRRVNHRAAPTDGPRATSERTRLHSQGIGRRITHAPPFGGPISVQEQDIISLSDADDDEIVDTDVDLEYEFNQIPMRTPTPFHPPSSPEIEIVSERQVPEANRRQNSRSTARQPQQPGPAHPPPAAYTGPFGYFPDLLRRGTNAFYRNRAVDAYEHVLRDHLQRDQRRNQQQNRNQAAGEFAIHLDYRQAGFDLGGLEMYERSSETPQAIQEPYKAPPAAKEGFIRTFKEESVVLCPMCGDELAIGEGVIKQQVWVVKACGHVYCGDCATNRHSTKANKKDRKPVSEKSTPFKSCVVDGCDSKVSNKLAMFPVYL